MFTKKTVFIIGAGGSYNLGLPLGNLLKSKIAEKLNFNMTVNGLDSGDRLLGEALDGIYGGDFHRMILKARAIAMAMPQAWSIDNYLDANSDDEEILFLGKAGIAAAILETERESKSMFMDFSSNDVIDFSKVPQTWHQTFCQMLFEGRKKTDLENLFENVAFITFNYDRVIEHYMVHAVRNYYAIPRDQAEKVCRKLEVVHAYGQVGVLPWRELPGRPMKFGAQPGTHTLPEIVDMIKTFTEKYERNDRLQRIHDLTREAQNMIHIGFSS